MPKVEGGCSPPPLATISAPGLGLGLGLGLEVGKSLRLELGLGLGLGLQVGVGLELTQEVTWARARLGIKFRKG